MPRVCTKNEVDVLSTKCGALLFCILHCQNGALRVFTNECDPRQHHDGGTTSLHHHSFDHILRCTGPIFSKLKPLERTWDTSYAYAAKSKIHKMSASTNKSQSRAFVPKTKLMWYQQHAARCHSVHYTVRMKQCVRSQTNVPQGTTMMGGQHHCTITLLIISCIVLGRFSPTSNHWNGHDIHLMLQKGRYTNWALSLTEVNDARLYQKRSWCVINNMRNVAIPYITLSE